MSRVWCFVMVLVSATLLCGSAGAGAGDGGRPGLRIPWLLNDYPPLIIVDGALPGAGIVDDFLRYVTSRMPEYEHVFQRASIARVVGLMQQGQPVCHPSLLLTPERQAYIDFSKPVNFALAHQVIVRRDRLDAVKRYIGADGRVDLPTLLAGPELVTAVTANRALPSLIARALVAAGESKQIIIDSGNDFQTPFRQLAAGWIDYLMAYPLEVQWYTAKAGAAGSPVAYIPIRGMPELMPGYVGCTKGEWGRGVVDKVNALVAEGGAHPPWFDFQLRFLDAEARRRTLEALDRLRPFETTAQGATPP